ncbi:MAG: ribonuclease P protein component [Bacteroidales bacterium]|nr:ribonuclease P protein component [Bacteroidales bacterium]
MLKNNGLNKSDKLKSIVRIENIFDEGKSFWVFPFSVCYTINSKYDTDKSKMMISVSKHYFKHAVDRNRLKRLTREAFRLKRQNIIQLANSKGIFFSIAFIYKCRQVCDFNTISKAMDEIMNRMGEIISLS